jgi:hypothetical protein
MSESKETNEGYKPNVVGKPRNLDRFEENYRENSYNRENSGNQEDVMDEFNLPEETHIFDL